MAPGHFLKTEPRRGDNHMKLRLLRVASALIAVAATAASTAAFAQPSLAPTGNDWPYTAGNLANWGYTSLTQIDKSNIKNLGAAWVTHVSAEPVTAPVAGPGTTTTAQQTIPIVVDGIMYLDTP